MRSSYGDANVDRATDITEAALSDDHYNQAVEKYQDAINKDPMNYWLWHNLCKVRIARDDLEGAISGCEVGADKFPNSPAPIMMLSNLYAAKGDYTTAVTKAMQCLTIKASLLCLALESKDPFIGPESEENDGKQIFEQ